MRPRYSDLRNFAIINGCLVFTSFRAYSKHVSVEKKQKFNRILIASIFLLDIPVERLGFSSIYNETGMTRSYSVRF